MKRPKIGLTTFINSNSKTETSAVNFNYINAVIKAGGIPCLIPFTVDESLLEQYSEEFDGFLFIGGVDVSPSNYGENPSKELGFTSLRLDEYHLTLLKKVLYAKKPILGICRGNQLLNVALGGTLYQDMSEFPDKTIKHVQETDYGDISHKVTIMSGTSLFSCFGESVWTNSYHHQSVKDLGRNLIISAKSDDGVVEAIEMQDYPYGVGIQWHPEAMLIKSDSMLPLFKSFLDACNQ